MLRYLTMLVVICAIVLGFAAPGVEASSEPHENPALVAQVGAWSAEYYNNRSFSGQPIIGPALPGGFLAIDWGLGSPTGGVNADDWSSRFTQIVNFPVGGNIVFEAKADDTVTVRVDGVAVTASAVYFQNLVYRGQITLAAGNHTITVEHTDITAQAYLYVSWTGGGFASSPSGVTGTVRSSVGLNFRNAPSLTATKIGSLGSGLTYPVIGRSADNLWAYIDNNGVKGWAYAALLNFNGNFNALPVVDGSTTTPPVTVPPGNVVLRAYPTFTMRVRNCASTQCTQVGRLPFRTLVDVLGQSADGQWLLIRYTTTTGVVTGWSFKLYFRNSTDNSVLPTTLPVVQ